MNASVKSSEVMAMVKGECVDLAKAAIGMRDALMRLNIDIGDEKTRKERYDPSGFVFVARSYAHQLTEKGYIRAGDLMNDAALHYPTDIKKFPDKSSADISQAVHRLEGHMVEKIAECECEKL